MSKTLACIRASFDGQDVEHQRQEILAYADQQKITIDEWIEIAISLNKSSRKRRIDELKARLQPGDELIVSELKRLGRSTGEVIIMLSQLVAFGITVNIIRQRLHLGQRSQDEKMKTIVETLAQFSELEREFNSVRTTDALAAKKAAGVILGKPKGTIQTSIYDKDRERIRELLNVGVSRRRIVEKHLGYGTVTSLCHYIRTRGILEESDQTNLH